MKQFSASVGLAAAFVLTLFQQGVRGIQPDVEKVLKMIPADMPITAVVINFEQLDQNISAFVKSADPKGEGPKILKGLKDELAIGALVDFGKPVGIAQANLMGGNNNVIWAHVPGFADKVKAIPAAKEEGGVWSIAPENKDAMFCTVKGDIVIAATSKEALERATKVERSMADELKERLNLLDDRQFLLHVNFDPLRPMAMQGFQQVGMMLPAVLGGLAAQGGVDPAGATAAISGLLEGVRKFIEQLAYLEILGNMGTTFAEATLAVGFKEGAIKSYLESRKPAAVGLLTDIEDQPYLFAMACHVPGKDSPFFDWLFERIGSAVASAPGAGSGAPGATAGSPDATKEYIQIARDLYRKAEGWSMAVNFSQAGMRVFGGYVGADAPGIFELAKKSVVQTNPLAKSFSGGMAYEPSGSKKIGEVNVEEFSLKMDASNPQSAQMAMMMGANSRLFMGVVGDRVHYFMGPEAEASKAFAAKIEKPMVASPMASEVVKGLPPKRNALILVDPSNIVNTIAAMTGQAAKPVVAAGPVAVSISLAGEPARVDVRVPLKSLEAVIKAASSETTSAPASQ